MHIFKTKCESLTTVEDTACIKHGLLYFCLSVVLPSRTRLFTSYLYKKEEEREQLSKKIPSVLIRQELRICFTRSSL